MIESNTMQLILEGDVVMKENKIANAISTFAAIEGVVGVFVVLIGLLGSLLDENLEAFFLFLGIVASIAVSCLMFFGFAEIITLLQKNADNQEAILARIAKEQPEYAEATPNVADELRKYKELKDEGVITEEAFQEKKEQLLMVDIAETRAPKGAAAKKVVYAGGNSDIAPLLKRIFMFLEDGDWTSANEYCESVLDVDPENAMAYLGNLLSDLRVKNKEKLREQAKPFDNNKNYQKVMRFADEELKAELNGYIEYINSRNKKTRMENIYNSAVNAMAAANDENSYNEAAQQFESICEYEDSVVLAKECREKAERSRKDKVLSEAKAKMNDESLVNYESAIEMLESISGFEDADELLYICRDKFEKIRVREEAARLERERQAEITRQEEEKRAKRNKKIRRIVIPIICIITIPVLVFNNIIAPSPEYKAMKIKYIKSQARDMKNISIGTYEQDNNLSNGKENIKWQVLKVEDDKALIVSEYALDMAKSNTALSWPCSHFFEVAFSEEEKAIICEKGTSKEKVFLLSTDDIKLLDTMECKATDYAIYRGAFESEKGTSYWWVRTATDRKYGFSYVDADGNIVDCDGILYASNIAIRPAMWIDITE